MTTDVFYNGQSPAAAEIIASADYKSVDPAAVFLRTNGADGLIVTVDTSAATGGGGVTVTISGVDPDGNLYTLLASALIASATVTRLQVGQNVPAATNTAAQAFLPSRVKVACVGSGTRTTLTYSVTAELSGD